MIEESRDKSNEDKVTPFIIVFCVAVVPILLAIGLFMLIGYLKWHF